MKTLLIFLIIASLLVVSATAEIKGPEIIVKLINQNPDPTEPGDNAELRFRFENNGSRSIGSLQVELLPRYPFSIGESALKDLGSLDAKQVGLEAVVVKYVIAVDKNADEGEHDLRLRYRLGDSNWITTPPFKISVKSVEAILSVVSATSREQLSSGSEGSLDIVLKNFGKSLLKDVRIKLDLESVPFAPVGSSNEIVISSISAGQTRTATFGLTPDTDADSAHYKTTVVLNYVDDSGKTHVRNSTIGLFVYNTPEFNVALKETKVFTPGTNGEVVISISNTGPGEIRFMTAELLNTPDYKVISSPSVYVGNLEADDFETAEFDIAIEKIRPRVINLNVRLTYKDSLNREIISDELIKHPVYSNSDAARLGLISKPSNFLLLYLRTGISFIALVFGLFMLIDCWKNNLPKYKKVLWTAIILTSIGALLYYFIARRKK